MLILTTKIVCSHLEGVLKDCVRLDVSQRRLAWRVGVGGNGLFVLSVGGGVRERAGMVLGLSLVWRKRSVKMAAGALSGCQLAFTTIARALLD